MRISDWSSDVCSSDLIGNFAHHKILADLREQQTSYFIPQAGWFRRVTCPHYCFEVVAWIGMALMSHQWAMLLLAFVMHNYLAARAWKTRQWYRSRFPAYPPGRKCRSEEHTSELQSLMRISSAVFCLNTKHKIPTRITTSAS